MTDNPPGADNGKMLSERHRLDEAKIWSKALFPLLVGILVFLVMIYSATADNWLAARNWNLVPASPFRGVQLVYAMIFSSLATVLVGTSMYLGELKHMLAIAAQTGGASHLRLARALIFCAMLILVLYFIVTIVNKNSATATDACNLHILHQRVLWHDICVGVTFALFLAADWQTLVGMNKAAQVCAGNIQRIQLQNEIQLTREFSKQQTLLVDLPVLAGFFVSLMIVLSAGILRGWDAASFYVNPSVVDFLAARRDNTLFMCSSQPIDIREFQQTVGSIFTAGIAMGYLAAHVLMSQLVFIALNFLFRQKRAALHAAGAHNL